MHGHRKGRLLTGAAVALLAWPMAAAPAAGASLTGTPALAGETVQVSGILDVEVTGPLTRRLELVMSSAETGEPITAFDKELTKELHVISVDSAFSTFIHEHAEKSGPDGSFHVDVRFPEPGLYHVYADAAPSDLGQQVLRFDLQVGADQPDGLTPPVIQAVDVLSARAGTYTVEIDASKLRAGQESLLELRVSKDGRPADDLGPYLGVPAHAVFIAAEDLAYVHAHATAPDPTAEAGSQQHGHGGHGSHDMQEPGASSLSVHVTPPAPGTYGLWIQFMGGGEVQTAPFVVSVQEQQAARP